MSKNLRRSPAPLALSFSHRRRLPRPTSRAQITVDAARPGAKIDRHIFGQFAEHLGRGIYEGIWVGPDSPIPTRAASATTSSPRSRPSRCRTCAGPAAASPMNTTGATASARATSRPATLNPNWGGVIEPNTFGTHEFMDFVQQIGADAYLSINVGSGTPAEAADWLEYLTTPQPTALGKERAANGHPEPYRDRHPRHRQRDLGLRRLDDARLLREPAQDLRALRAQLQHQAEDAAHRRRARRRATPTTPRR